MTRRLQIVLDYRSLGDLSKGRKLFAVETDVDAIRRSLFLAAMIHDVVSAGGSIVMRDERGREKHLEFVRMTENQARGRK